MSSSFSTFTLSLILSFTHIHTVTLFPPTPFNPPFFSVPLTFSSSLLPLLPHLVSFSPPLANSLLLLSTAYSPPICAPMSLFPRGMSTFYFSSPSQYLPSLISFPNLYLALLLHLLFPHPFFKYPGILFPFITLYQVLNSELLILSHFSLLCISHSAFTTLPNHSSSSSPPLSTSSIFKEIFPFLLPT